MHSLFVKLHASCQRNSESVKQDTKGLCVMLSQEELHGQQGTREQTQDVGKHLPLYIVCWARHSLSSGRQAPGRSDPYSWGFGCDYSETFVLIKQVG